MTHQRPQPNVRISSATSVLFVDRVEPTREFFLKAGFEVMFEVPEGDRLGFVGLHHGGVQVMVESRGNSNEHEPFRGLTRESRRAVVFIEVDDLGAVIAALKGERIAAERHTTFYNADELTYEEPGGNLITFAKITRKE